VTQRERILVIDEDRDSRTSLIGVLVDRGYQVVGVTDGREALDAFATHAPHLVLADLRLSGVAIDELVARLHTMPDPAPIVVLTGFGDLDAVIETFRNGASDYLTRPVDPEQLLAVVARTLAAQHAQEEIQRLRVETRSDGPRSELLGSSLPMQHLQESIEHAASSRATVLILGESGTGKELVASAIHQRGRRAAGPLVRVHCAALAESLLEAELFGHEKGAFTGAVARRPGRFELAHQGTLFLDEIGEISPTVQIKLLRVLQDHAIERVGGNETIRVDVRLVAATNRDLPQLVADGRFRADLYYRLNVLPIQTPALRDRPEDIPVLAHHSLARHARAMAKTLTGFTTAALEALVRHPWPGNVRELENAIELAAVMATSGAEIDVSLLPPEIAGERRPLRPVRPPMPGSTLAELERYAILTTLEACGGSTSRAAHVLGISARKIQYRLHEYSDAPRSGVEAVGVRR
jgi:DNA-binding NtrC family response regulator